MIYVFLVIFAVLLQFILGKLGKKGNERLLLIILFMIIASIIGLRSSSVGADTQNYLDMYKKLRLMSINEIINKEEIEIGYIWLVKILNKISPNAQLLLIVQGIIVSMSYAKFFIKNTKNTLMSFFGYLAFGIFAFQLTGIRQSIAMSICILGIEFIKSKKVLNFILIILLASLFHTSALYFIIAYPIGNMKVTKKNTINLFIIGIIATIFIEPLIKILGSISERYANYGIEGTGTSIIFLIIILTITVFIEKYKYKMIEYQSYNAIFIQLNYISCILWIMRLITRVVERPSLYFMPATIIAMCNTFSVIKDRKFSTFIYCIALTSIVILFLYKMMAIPYSSVLNS